jgi:hypothetical protein
MVWFGEPGPGIGTEGAAMGEEHHRELGTGATFVLDQGAQKGLVVMVGEQDQYVGYGHGGTWNLPRGRFIAYFPAIALDLKRLRMIVI